MNEQNSKIYSSEEEKVSNKCTEIFITSAGKREFENCRGISLNSLDKCKEKKESGGNT